MSESCPIFRGTGKKAKIERECESCPFKDDCIQDIFDDAIAKVVEILGRYIKNENNTTH